VGWVGVVLDVLDSEVMNQEAVSKRDFEIASGNNDNWQSFLTDGFASDFYDEKYEHHDGQKDIGNNDRLIEVESDVLACEVVVVEVGFVFSLRKGLLRDDLLKDSLSEVSSSEPVDALAHLDKHVYPSESEAHYKDQLCDILVGHLEHGEVVFLHQGDGLDERDDKQQDGEDHGGEQVALRVVHAFQVQHSLRDALTVIFLRCFY
jgi:hypothetical protein